MLHFNGCLELSPVPLEQRSLLSQAQLAVPPEPETRPKDALGYLLLIPPTPWLQPETLEFISGI